MDRTHPLRCHDCDEALTDAFTYGKSVSQRKSDETVYYVKVNNEPRFFSSKAFDEQKREQAYCDQCALWHTTGWNGSHPVSDHSKPDHEGRLHSLTRSKAD